jgi:hypothetical protein
LINSLPPLIGQPKYATLASAIAWLQGQNKYFIVNQNYPIIVTDELVFYVDAGLTGSYPIKGTSWYDVSGGGKKATLVNGPAFVNSGSTSYIFFDGTDDITTTDFTQTFSSQITVECTYLGTKTARNHLWGLGNYSSNTNLTADFNDSGLSLWVYWNGGGSPAIRYTSPNFTDGTVKHLVFTHNNTTNKTYLNGDVLTPYDVLGTQSFSPAVGGVMEIGGFLGGVNFGGNIYKFAIYNKELSQAEILQNYYQGPIVTDSIRLGADPGNIISYPGNGTTLYDMSVNKNNGTITNGPTYSINEGGVLSFDGTDDYVTFGNPGALVISTNVSMSLWIKGDINEQNPSQNIYPFAKEDSYGIKVSSGTSPGVGMIVRIGGNYVTCAGSNVLDGKWNHVVVTYDGQGIRSYVNGVLDSQNLSVSGSLDAGGNVSYGAWTNGYGFFNGYLSDAKIYNKVLSPTEVMQNFNAQRNRFQSNQAFANGGTVSTVIENGINYRVHTFTSSGTLTVLSAGIVEVLTVAGGGGGSGNFYDDGAGGGGGGLIYNTDYTVTTGNKTVTVGSGGVASSGGAGGNGNNSVFDNLTAIGGGGGAPHRSPGVSGGSGGGGGGSFVGDGQSNAGGSALQPGSASGGKGNRGGNGGIGDVISGGGGYPGSAGGGGAGQQGFPPTGGGTNEGGKGGDGAQISINGTPTYYAGGGGGVRNGVGGLGGGGTASYGRDGSPAGGGGVNTGGGGGGGRAFTGETGVPGPGGSGIVIIRYRI